MPELVILCSDEEDSQGGGGGGGEEDSVDADEDCEMEDRANTQAKKGGVLLAKQLTRISSAQQSSASSD